MKREKEMEKIASDNVVVDVIIDKNSFDIQKCKISSEFETNLKVDEKTQGTLKIKINYDFDEEKLYDQIYKGILTELLTYAKIDFDNKEITLKETRGKKCNLSVFDSLGRTEKNFLYTVPIEGTINVEGTFVTENETITIPLSIQDKENFVIIAGNFIFSKESGKTVFAVAREIVDSILFDFITNITLSVIKHIYGKLNERQYKTMDYPTFAKEKLKYMSLLLITQEIKEKFTEKPLTDNKKEV